ncbi:hypothetical protein FRX31_026756 [Thalictrum thalictroides]|uniref:Uncharacterized protein n=1 Tax=Thalictrum thalictroides TaxID=46969 RepID=A0A7J6VFJ0_THATH|nr:hypothetical protein FRX31_026756 [Thalictrum thalictroides]
MPLSIYFVEATLIEMKYLFSSVSEFHRLYTFCKLYYPSIHITLWITQESHIRKASSFTFKRKFSNYIYGPQILYSLALCYVLTSRKLTCVSEVSNQSMIKLHFQAYLA